MTEDTRFVVMLIAVGMCGYFLERIWEKLNDIYRMLERRYDNDD